MQSIVIKSAQLLKTKDKDIEKLEKLNKTLIKDKST